MSYRFAVLALLLACTVSAADQPQILLLAGEPGRRPGEHDWEAGANLLRDLLAQNGAEAAVFRGGWPEDATVLKSARALVFFMSGGKRHAILQENRLSVVGELVERGVGIACLHYAVEVPAEHGPKLQEWIGGFYEKGHSVNPKEVVSVTRASPGHPISRGWDSFTLKDEWYNRLRFRPDDDRLTPILTAMLPKDAPQLEKLGWAVERADGGRGFGFTGGHYHENWGEENFRRLVVNALLWTAQIEVPAGGARVDLEPGTLEKYLTPATQ